MRRLLITIMLAGIFFAGYSVGRLPGSPDLASWVSRNYHHAAYYGRRLVAVLGGKIDTMSEPVASQ